MFFSGLCPFLENESEPTDKPVSGHCLVVLNRFTFECRFRFAFSKLSRKMEKPDPHKKIITVLHCLHIINSLFHYIAAANVYVDQFEQPAETRRAWRHWRRGYDLHWVRENLIYLHVTIRVVFLIIVFVVSLGILTNRPFCGTSKHVTIVKIFT
jgi:hypothetical protein